MNREILFRGKDLETGKWLYGSFIKTPNHAHISTSGEAFPAKVEPKTVGQYTGLTDKNSVKIFEGDIITFEDVCCEGGSGYEYPYEWAVETMNRAEIIIRNGCVCFGKELFETSAYEDIQSYYPNLNEWFAECAEVIGNIHDNPELLKA